MNNRPTLSVIIPALNEEKNILLVIDNTLTSLKEFAISGEIIVINDGSRDSTPLLVKKKMTENPGIIKMINHDKPKGIGASFWDGVDNAEGEFVVLIPGDNENDPREILRYYELLKHVDIVIPFVFNKNVRSPLRNFLSSLYHFIINITFFTSFNYTNGTGLYRKSILKELEHRNNSFFFQTDILVRAVKKGYLFAEVPCRLGQRKEGSSKLITFSAAWGIIRGYLHLVKDHYFKKKKKEKEPFSPDSLTAIRRK